MINNNSYQKKDGTEEDILEYPENYEEIANLALINFEKNCPINLDKLINTESNHNENLINNQKDNNEDNNNYNKNDDWGDFEENEEDEQLNSYKEFKDENEDEDEEEMVSYNKNVQEDNIYMKCENQTKENCIIKEEQNNKDNEYDEKKINIETKIKKPIKKLNQKELKEKISQIKFEPPKWAKNLNDKKFIIQAKKLLLNNK